MATYTRVSRSVPSKQRTALITAVATGDKIDIHDVLGRSARGLKIITDDTTDTITYRLNNLLKLREHNPNSPFIGEEVEFWSAADSFSVFTATGATEHEIMDDLTISSIEVIDVTGPVSVSIVVW